MLGRTLLLAAAAVILLGSAGCGGAPQDAPEVVPVKGRVLRKGQPFPGVTVRYNPVDPKEGQNFSYGVTDANGYYELIYNVNLKGAVPGKHKVGLMAGDGFDDEDPTKPAPQEVVIPKNLMAHEVEVPPDGLNGGPADFDLDF
jgi:hypothetical protein